MRLLSLVLVRIAGNLYSVALKLHAWLSGGQHIPLEIHMALLRDCMYELPQPFDAKNWIEHWKFGPLKVVCDGLPLASDVVLRIGGILEDQENRR